MPSTSLFRFSASSRICVMSLMWLTIGTYIYQILQWVVKLPNKQMTHLKILKSLL
jgi:hypothetical protein